MFAAQTATNSPEFDAAPVDPGLYTIAIFEVQDLSAAIKRLGEHDVRVLVGIAHSEEVNELLESIYLRADIALSEAKDTFRAAV